MESQLRKYTLKFGFKTEIVRPKIFEFDDWFYNTFKVHEDDVFGVSYDFLSNQYVVKLRNDEICQRIMHLTAGSAEFKTSSNEVSPVSITYAGLGLRTVKVHLLPFELELSYIKDALSTYGTVYEVTADRWEGNLRYKVDNGIRTVKIDLKSHIPSFVYVYGFKALVVYEGQPRTCSACNQPGHLRSHCPRRRPVQLPAEEGPEGGLRPQYSAAASRLLIRERTPADVTAASLPAAPQPTALPEHDDVEMPEAPATTTVPEQPHSDTDTATDPGSVADDTTVTKTVLQDESAACAPLDDTSVQTSVLSDVPPRTTDGTQDDRLQEPLQPVAPGPNTTTARDELSAATKPAAQTSKKSNCKKKKDLTGRASPEKKKIRVASEGDSATAKELRAVAQHSAAKDNESQPKTPDPATISSAAPMESDDMRDKLPDDPWWMDTDTEETEDLK